ncbi:MAG: type IV pilus modification PilV family protein [Pyrinomonadaceae bacterium]
MKADQNEPTITLRQSRQNSQQGFTLIETSIALVVMMIVGLGVASLFAYAMSNNMRGSDRVQSLAVAQEQMEQLRKTPFATLSARVTALGGSDRTVTRDGTRYRVVTTIADTVSGNANLKTVTVQAARLGPNTVGLTPGLVTMRATDSLGANLKP